MDRRRFAVHEAGHAVVAVALGIRVVYATIRPYSGLLRGRWFEASGHVMLATTPPCDLDALITLAGAGAEKFLCPEIAEPLAGPDAFLVRTLVHSDLLSSRLSAGTGLPTEADKVAALVPWQARTDAIVRDHSGWIARVAARLDEMTGLTGDEIAALRRA